MTSTGLKAMKETKYRNENCTIGITAADLFLSEKFQVSSSTVSYRLQAEV